MKCQLNMVTCPWEVPLEKTKRIFKGGGGGGTKTPLRDALYAYMN